MQQQLAGMPRPLYVASPSKMLRYQDCPRAYRMLYLDRPPPVARSQRAHTSVGVCTHNALRQWWDLPAASRTPQGGARLVRQGWIDTGFASEEQSARWRELTAQAVSAYLEQVDPRQEPLWLERSVAFRTATLGLHGRVDRLDDRYGELVVVDYKTSRLPPTEQDARTSLPLALYAVATAAITRRPCLRVELHHVPSGIVAGHLHTPQSLQRKLAEAESIVADLRRADADFGEVGIESELFAPRVGALCPWCDVRAYCPEGQQVGPERSSWAALDRP